MEADCGPIAEFKIALHGIEGPGVLCCTAASSVAEPHQFPPTARIVCIGHCRPIYVFTAAALPCYVLRHSALLLIPAYIAIEQRTTRMMKWLASWPTT
eukprot:scaffold22728_cov36-Prasinocladus_malaysianus.AAC.1